MNDSDKADPFNFREEFQRIRHRERMSDHDLTVEALKSANEAAFTGAARYTNLIVVVGYAAFFTMWGFVRSELSHTQVLWSGILMTLSVVLFIAFEVVKMVSFTRASKELQECIRESELAVGLGPLLELQERLTQRVNRHWVWWLSVIAGLGFSSAIILIWAFVKGLFESCAA